MSPRERWIVYPLLFLTMGIALRDKLIPPSQSEVIRLEAEEIVADRIQCRNRLDCHEMHCAQAKINACVCQNVLVAGPNGRAVVLATTDKSGKFGVVETFNTDGLPQVQLRSNELGGMVTALGHSGKVLMVLGYDEGSFGVFAQLADLPLPILLTLPWPFDSRLAPAGRTPPAVEEKKPK